MGELLFNPYGQINGRDFEKGAVVLLAINFFLWLAWYGGVGVGGIAGFLSLGFIYCWFCLYAKRLRGVGQSPAWFIMIFSGFTLGSYVLAGFLLAALSPELLEKFTAFQELQSANPDNPEVVLPLATELMKNIAIPYAIAYFIVGAFCAFGINKRLPEV